MEVHYRVGKSAYEVTLHRYEHRLDEAAYSDATEEWRLNRQKSVNYSNNEPYPDRDKFSYVMEYNITGDNVTFLTHNYPTIEKLPSAYKGRRLNSDEVCRIELNKNNHDYTCRGVQASAFKEHGYHGPIGGGEARGLRNLFTEMNQSDLVRRGYAHVTKTVTRPPSKYQIRRAQWNNQPAPPSRRVNVDMLQYCYVFKSPLPSVPFEKFVKLARMYKSDRGGLRRAVLAVLANPEAHKEVETIDALDILGKMVGMD